MTRPKLLADAKTYYRDVQLKTQSYDPVLTAEDRPAIHLNEKVMKEMRPQMEKYYYDPARYSTYLEQLGIAYPGPAADKYGPATSGSAPPSCALADLASAMTRWIGFFRSVEQTSVLPSLMRLP